jgi:hypothetical protein
LDGEHARVPVGRRKIGLEFELGDNPKVTATASNCPRFLP